jgi:hypothetical protein
VKVYIDPEKLKKQFDAVPAPLRRKAVEDYDRAATARGFRCVRNCKDENGQYADVEIRPGTSLQDVYSFLKDFNAAAVTLDAHDVPRILGKNIVSLGMSRELISSGPAACGLELIEPDELANSIDEARRAMWRSQPTDLDGEEFVTSDLVNEGYLSQDEVTAQDDWLEAKQEQPGLRIGSGGPYTGDEDMAEYGPDTDELEWNEGF